MTAEPSPQSYAVGLAAQDGVVSRAQLFSAKHGPHDVERQLRRKELFVALPGVYINHNGPRTWQQRAWVAVLSAWPAALTGASALRAENGPACAASTRTRRSTWPSTWPRVRYEEAVLDVVAALPREWDVIETCAAAVRSRCTTADRLAIALEARHRFPRRGWLGGIFADVAAGTASVLEHGYLDRVERAHGLPAADRQQPDRVAGGRVYRDAPIRRTTWTSSWTAVSTIGPSRIAIVTWSATSRPRRPDAAPSGSVGVRSTTGRAGPPP